MHPHLKSLLVKAGCAADASDDDAQKFYDAMSADKKSEIDGDLARLMEGDDEGMSARSVPPLPGEPTEALSAKLTAAVTTAVLSALKKSGTAAVGNAQARQVVDDDDAALAAEEARAGRIRKLCALHAIPDPKTAIFVSEGGTFEDVRKKVLAHIHETAKPLASVKVGDDQRVTALRAAIPQALCLRAGVGERDKAKTAAFFDRLGEKQHEMTAGLSSQSMLDMFRVYLVGLGVDANAVYSLSRTSLAGSLGPHGLRQRFPRIGALAESTSDFSNITLDAINKTLRFSYLDAKRTWPIWAEKKFAPDFKTINAVVLSEAPSMISANEGGEMKYVTLSDSKETAVLTTYKAGIRLTRNAIINDDLDAFNTIPRAQANSAARLEDDNAYALLTTNANMSDGNALFSTQHVNYTSSGGVPSVTSLQTGATAVKKQKGLAGAARLELEPKFLLVPSSIEEQTKELVGSSTLIAAASTTATTPQGSVIGNNNPFFNRYQIIGSTRLDDASATAWYLLADFRDGQINTFSMYFLTDEPEPVLRSETDFDTEDVKYLVRHTNVGLVNDFRGGYKNNGA